MAELTENRGGSFRRAELASYDIPAKQPEGPKLVKGQEPKTLDGAGCSLGAYALVF